MQMGVTMTSIDDAATRSRFKVVCEDCGGLSIKVEDPAHSPVTVLVRCGRCNAIRGTLAELHEMARRSTDSFEF